MDLPPPWYALLLGVTLIAVPFVTWWVQEPSNVRRARAVLLSLALLELALILLFYSVLVCWILAGAAAISLARTAYPANKAAATILVGAVSLAAGLLFQLLPGLGGFLTYFAVGLPLMLGLPLAVLVANWLRWDPRASTVVAAAVVLAFSGTFAASAFAQDFLRRFEITHLPATLLTIGALGWLLAQGSRRADAARDQALRAMDPGEYAARAVPSRHVANIFHAVATLACLGGALALLVLGPQDLRITLAILTLAAVGLAPLLARHTVIGTIAASARLFGALLIPISPLYEHYLRDQEADVLLFLGLAALATTASLLAWSTAWALFLDQRRRLRALQGPVDVPRTFLHRVQGRAATVEDLRGFAQEIRRLGAPAGVLTVQSPGRGPLASLADDVYEWLEQDNDPRARIHVALYDAGQTFLVPPIVPEEQDA